MSRYRIRVHDEDEGGPNGLLLLAAGALAGFATGVYLSQRFGGVAGVTSKLRARFGAHEEEAHEDVEYEEEEDEVDEEVFVSANEELEERVLSAFTNDPTLRQRAVDIGAVAKHTIELTGHVLSTDEAEHAAVIARGVPGVEVVVNRLHVRQDEQGENSAAEDSAADADAVERLEDDDPRWEDEGVDGMDGMDAADDVPDANERRPQYYDTHTAQEPRTEPPRPSA